jgi:TonB family protein
LKHHASSAFWSLYRSLAPDIQRTADRAYELPVPTKTVNPDYPAAARERLLNADVRLRILVDSRGRVAKADVLDRAPLFEANAIKAVKKWRFEPAKRNGEAVPTVGVVTTTFRVTTQRLMAPAS